MRTTWRLYSYTRVTFSKLSWRRFPWYWQGFLPTNYLLCYVLCYWLVYCLCAVRRRSRITLLTACMCSPHRVSEAESVACMEDEDKKATQTGDQCEPKCDTQRFACKFVLLGHISNLESSIFLFPCLSCFEYLVSIFQQEIYTDQSSSNNSILATGLIRYYSRQYPCCFR